MRPLLGNEDRAADMRMHPCLGTSMTTASVVEDIVDRLDPGKAPHQNPHSLREAVEILRGDELARKVSGDSMLHSCLHCEVDEWNVSIRQ